MKLTHTAISNLTLEKVEAYSVTVKKKAKEVFWRHKDCDGKHVGPIYPTKAEALFDTYDYAVRAGWMPKEEKDE